ncbi:TetR/AcrR family transcriptional regulator [Agromyces sp. Soil535]|uniref:TetR/AcrR family transcriptional regulator n=1 Tax=Agromyces sp. Soil535 TaxID=1736390 RepID=UPI00138F64C2|nr:TetR/AcrR family transcriptional regulator [Agromyces sp. Soil535]
MSEIVRPPLQERSRVGWERILDTGLTLLEEGGYEALTISEVCRRADVSAPSIYARVDGRLGPFFAVYERGIARVVATEDHAFGRATGSVERTVEAIVEVFEMHAAFLRAVIRHSSSDPQLLDRGAAESRRVLGRIIAALPHDREDMVVPVAWMLYTECAFRAMYGERFLSSTPESREAFTARLNFVARRMLDADG